MSSPAQAVTRFGLIGQKLGHSWSQAYFREKFRRETITECSYSLFPLRSIEELPALVSRYRNLRGLNVTIPYKEQVMPFLDGLSDTARSIGAVNTILIERDKAGSVVRLTGHNTDAYGFEESLGINGLIKPLAGEGALVLGTGGASKAVCWVLKKLGWTITMVSRSVAPGGQAGGAIINYSELNDETMDRHTLIVNTTPLGMYPNVAGFPDIPYKKLTDRHILYDLVYNPETTKFMMMGQKAGCKVIGGLTMLELQAEKAWEIWSA